MEQWNGVRQRVLVNGESKRQVLRTEGMHWTTLEKMLEHSEPPGYRQGKPRAKPKIGPYLEQIRSILKEDQTAPRKQRHTAKRILERLKALGYTGGYSQVKEAVRDLRVGSQEVYVPLIHRPGEAQVDFGHAYVTWSGAMVRVAYFCLSLPYSDAMFVRVFERECTETFWAGHVEAFEFLGGVPWRLTYDNTSVAVKDIVGAHDRKLTDGFLRLQSHYLFKAHFCQPARANEKGVVEGAVGFARRNYLVPVPEVNGLEELNARLEEQCREDMNRRLRGQEGTKAELLEADRAAFVSLPASPFDACEKVSTTVGSLSLVRYDRNDYSVPVSHAFHPVVVKGYADRVEIHRGTERIATHRRLWGKEGVQFDPLHYLELLERKPGALDHARPLAGWVLPECFDVLRRRLEDEEEDGTREYIRVLRLIEKHALAEVAEAVEKGLAIRAHTRDAIAQFLIPQEDWRATVFRLDGREHLRQVRVATTPPCVFRALMGAGGGA